MTSGIDAIGAVTPAQTLAMMREGLSAGKKTTPLVPDVPQTSVLLPATHPSPPPAPSAPMIGSVQMLVTLAALSPAEIRKRALATRAQRALNELDRLHRELLSGAVHRATVRNLTQWLNDHEKSAQDQEGEDSMAEDEQCFVALLRDIELRIKVELAKLNLPT